MENSNFSFTIGALILIVSLGIGYVIGSGGTINSPATDSANMHGAMGAMTSGLTGKTGDELDKAFLDEMIVHHEGAVEMAQTLLAGTKRPELTKLGNDIITAQTKEIQMMKDWRKAWFNQ